MVRYEVNNFGEVRHAKRKHILKPRPFSNSGYLMVHSQFKGKKIDVHIHSLVAKAFVDGYGEGKTVNHINGDRTDNRASNLEWVTQSENALHGAILHCRPIRIHLDDGSERCFLSKVDARRLGYRKYLERRSRRCWEHINHWQFYASAQVFGDYEISDKLITPFRKYYKYLLYNRLFKHFYEEE